jgi:hypothetical protein
MAKLPSTDKTEVVIFRLSPKLKGQLSDLAKKSRYGGSISSAIRIMIESASRK